MQLHSVGNAVERDSSGTIARLASTSSTTVEPYAFAERTGELAAAFTAAGVGTPSGHAAVIDAVDPAWIFDAAEQLGINAVIDPFLPSERQSSSSRVHIFHASMRCGSWSSTTTPTTSSTAWPRR